MEMSSGRRNREAVNFLTCLSAQHMREPDRSRPNCRRRWSRREPTRRDHIRCGRLRASGGPFRFERSEPVCREQLAGPEQRHFRSRFNCNRPGSMQAVVRARAAGMATVFGGPKLQVRPLTTGDTERRDSVCQKYERTRKQRRASDKESQTSARFLFVPPRRGSSHKVSATRRSGRVRRR